MKDGFIKIAAGCADIAVGDTGTNAAAVSRLMAEADAAGANLLALPELCLTGYTCGDLFHSQTLLDGAMEALGAVCDSSRGKYPLAVLGVPAEWRGKLYNCAAAVLDGELLALVPKTCLPDYGEFYEARQFASGGGIRGGTFSFRGKEVPFGTDILLQHESMERYCVGMELCEDLWAPCPPSGELARAGAQVIVNPSASDETIGKAEYRRALVASASARLLCGYVYCSAGPGESTQDMVFGGHRVAAENGTVLAEAAPFSGAGLMITEFDLGRTDAERRRQSSFTASSEGFRRVPFKQESRETVLTRSFAKNPFVPPSASDLSARAETILSIQAYGLKKRLEHTGARKAVIGVSGGLDSTLALLAAVRAFDLMGKPRADVSAVTMPCFGTTDRTRRNAARLCRVMGASLRSVPIAAAVERHFADIGHDPAATDGTYENSQARERTQVLMDIANQENGIVVGTGDLSELALGWATYNGDHMSMYGVNASVPKTLVRYIVGSEAERLGGEAGEVLKDILATPVSPELLPAGKDGSISQRTEDIVGPYELHDFFLYYFLRFGFSPAKIYRLALLAFAGEYGGGEILKWLRVFVRRFFSQQFKRSCLPDGPKVGSAALSPRGDWRMPSDAVSRLWLAELDRLG